ncbi:MAG: rhomboid family intramembrane serine protease [Amphiplicatus sp.]
MNLSDEPRDDKRRAPPLFNAPSIVTALIIALVGCQIVIEALPDRAQYFVARFGSVSPHLFLSGLRDGSNWLMTAAPLFTHIFIHADWSHLFLNSIWLLAFGAPTAIRLGAGRRLFDVPSAVFLLFFLLSGAVGALAFVVANMTLNTLLIGASGGVSGLLGALVRSAFHRQYGHANVRQPFARLADSRVIVASVVILAMNFVVGVFGALAPGGAEIAWEAHMGGYLFGLFAFTFFARLARRY